MKNSSMATLKEMVTKFITPECNINARMLVLEHIFGMTADEKGLELILSADILPNILDVINAWGPNIRKIICKILVNLSTAEDACRTILTAPMRENLVSMLINIILNNQESADYACMTLCNITRREDILDAVVADFKPFDDTIPKLLKAFVDVSHRTEGYNLDHIAMLFCNLSRNTDVRKYYLNHDGVFINAILPFISYPDSRVRRQGVVCTVRNCSFVTEEHDWILRELKILPRILLPLTGNEDFTDEENEQLPEELQYMPSTKEREPDESIRKNLIEILNQFCTTEAGRTFMRDNGVYYILREYHKWEKTAANIFACLNVVDILIRTEDEIGIDNIADDVDIPDDVLEQLRKAQINMGSCLLNKPE